MTRHTSVFHFFGPFLGWSPHPQAMRFIVLIQSYSTRCLICSITQGPVYEIKIVLSQSNLLLYSCVCMFFGIAEEESQGARVYYTE